MILSSIHAVIVEKLVDHSKTYKSTSESTPMRDHTHADFVINVSKSPALEADMRDKSTKQTKHNYRITISKILKSKFTTFYSSQVV